MAGGAAFADYNKVRPSPSPAMVGQMLGPQAPPDAGPMMPPDPDMDMDAGVDTDADGDGMAVMEPVMRQRHGEADTPYDPDMEHGPTSTRRSLEYAIERGLSASRGQSPPGAAPGSRLQLKRLGIPETELEVGRLSGLYSV